MASFRNFLRIVGYGSYWEQASDQCRWRSKNGVRRRIIYAADTFAGAILQFGDEWHQQRRSLILVVPSVVTSGIGRNVLINQDHPEFRSIKTSRPRDIRWDVRLFRGYSTR
jgi:RES domain-containing protein